MYGSKAHVHIFWGHKGGVKKGQGSTPVYSALELLVLCTIFFTSICLLSYITVVKTMVSVERGMNPAGLTATNSSSLSQTSPGFYVFAVQVF